MRIIKEFVWCVGYGMECVTATFDLANRYITVWDSHKIKKRKHMKEVIEWLRTYSDYHEITMAPMWYLICEWCAHNLLYSFGFKPEHTQHLDLDTDTPWYQKIGYVLLSFFYWGQ